MDKRQEVREAEIKIILEKKEPGGTDWVETKSKEILALEVQKGIPVDAKLVEIRQPDDDSTKATFVFCVSKEVSND